jgi:hypothetical protein
VRRPLLHPAGIALVLLLAAGAATSRAATITIINLDGANEGFNDPTPAEPVGGNPGTTIGAQRLFVFEYAAGIWEEILTSDVEIRVEANFDPLSCTATSGVLGSAGPITVFSDFPNAPFTATWYHVALANRLAGVDLDSGGNDIRTRFNSSVGSPDCLPAGWYYGVDGNEGNQFELLPVVLHELGHGLGFSTTTNGSTGAQLNNSPHVYDRFLFDNTRGLHWNEMNNSERAASGINCRKLAWDGPSVTVQAPGVLGPKPVLRLNSPAAIAGEYDLGAASFGPPLDETGVTGDVVLADDGDAYPTNACEPLVNGAEVSGKIALVDRGTCPFVTKVKNAQDAGAIAVIVADSVAGCPASAMGGSDPSITIPSVRVTQADGTTIKDNLGAGVNATMIVDPAQLAGTDASGRVLMYTPNPYQTGSSVSHWDTSTDPNLLMEPAINASLSSDVDLTRAHFADIGWFQGLLAVEGGGREERRLGAIFPNPSAAATTITWSQPREERVGLGIYDLSGRLVARLVDGVAGEGSHAVRWDGTDSSGRRAPAGVYLYRLKSGSFREAKYLVLVR